MKYFTRATDVELLLVEPYSTSVALAQGPLRFLDKENKHIKYNASPSV